MLELFSSTLIIKHELSTEWTDHNNWIEGKNLHKLIFSCLGEGGRAFEFKSFHIWSVSQFFMMIQWAAQDYDSLNWFIILCVSFDTSNFVRDLKLTFFTILGFIYTH